jgi:glycosyltransferase involved in cell wall biosynthesis
MTKVDVALPGLRCPVLSIAVTTFNRASWLKHSLSLILQQARPYRGIVEVVVCDNASQDDTAGVVGQLKRDHEFVYHRNEKNVGMLGNLGVSCDCSHGEYIWVIGDDDLIIEGALERVLSAIALHPNVELIYANYAFTRFDRPEDLRDVEQVIHSAKAISSAIFDAYVEHLSEVAANSENCFTAIYCLVFRADHARRAYHQDVSGRPFSTLPTTAPTADYVCRHMLDRPAYWIGDPCVAVNLNVSWMRYASLFILERFPELYDLMEDNGVSRDHVDALRARHVKNIRHWFEKIHTAADQENRPFFSPERLVERFGHLPAFQAHGDEMLRVYRRAFREGRVADRTVTPERLEAAMQRRKTGMQRR